MDYPGGFDTPAFPAGRYIASTRLVSIATMVLFFLIIVTCGFLLWAQRNVHIHPFLVSVNQMTGEWSVVGHHHTSVPQVSTSQSLQESVLHKFIQHWFWISSSDTVNTAMWQSCDRLTQCNPSDKTGIDTEACSLYCISGENIYTEFVETVVPGYLSRVSDGETWLLDGGSVVLSSLGTVAAGGGSWLVRAVVYSSVSGPIDIMAYATVSRDTELYPQTLGYYISEFNAYKMN